ncbi:MAG: ATP-dependent DNA helicase [Proteobacteria bacterium]|nr:ATP-dependent DNA helicase [Pseudomonadota bacterium]
MSVIEPAQPRILLPAAPVLIARVSGAVWLTQDGEIEELALADAALRIQSQAVRPIVCHAKAVARRLGLAQLAAHDVLELFAFVRPAQFALPTPRGLAAALNLSEPHSGAAEEAMALLAAARRLLAELSQHGDNRAAAGIARVMAASGWSWGVAVLSALGLGQDQRPHTGALEVWRLIEEWQETAPEPPPGQMPVEPAEARARLGRLLGEGAEPRPSQADYASAVSAAFAPSEHDGEPHFLIAEAGTGVGKTLGYIAPVSLWAEKNQGAVWLSTFTRNLQHQIDGELDRLYPDPAEKALKVVLRKGRENYVCLLNMEEAIRSLRGNQGDAVALGLMARWVLASRDGDMVGGDFPGWLADLVGRGRTLNLTDRRGECIYSACPHYQKCFIEKSHRRSRRATIVVANHALVMALAAVGGMADGSLSMRLVFDEGHHVFDAADSAFSLDLTAGEMVELRRWVIGAEGGRSGRARGLKRRIEDLVAGDDAAEAALDAALAAARALPAESWRERLGQGRPQGPAEAFLASVRQQVYARAQDADNAYSLETEVAPGVGGLLAAASALNAALGRLKQALLKIRARFQARLDDEAATLDTPIRLRLEATQRSLHRRGEMMVGGWQHMLAVLGAPAPPEFVDWFAVDRLEGRDVDLGMHRHWIDPTIPFAKAVAEPAHGVLVTSATLRDSTGDVEADWQVAEQHTGARHLSVPAIRAWVPSPFDYAKQTRVFVVNDLSKNDPNQVAAAYRELFIAAGGGALGLFTAIKRLREVYQRIAGPLDAAGLPLYAQHVDAIDTATLIDIFRAEKESCLLGTDAVRDGVDVPGRALRLIVFDRVPWPRPDILHKARRAAFGTKDYDDRLARLRLKQAFGRLIRRADDTGVFVLLDRALPSRLATAFPEGVQVRRIGLAEAVAETGTFLAVNPN